jgi:hypothetical protein
MGRFKHWNTFLSRKILLSVETEAAPLSNVEVFDGSIGVRSGFDSNGESGSLKFRRDRA